MELDTLTENNIAIAAIYPMRNMLMIEGGEGDPIELIENISEDNDKNILPGLDKLIESGWKPYTDETDGYTDFWQLPGWQQRELLSQWALRHVSPKRLVARVATPVPQFHVGRGYSFSWGHAFIGYVTGYSLNEIYKNALAWKEMRYDEARKEVAGIE